ncbi:hypothetical protein MKW92_009440 [Papaver armeniacum]|nr:hypothetical protein MKW92_009440 [Papaver armeniacum]
MLSPWKFIIMALGIPGHGSRMFDNSAMENSMKNLEVMTRYRDGQSDLILLTERDGDTPIVEATAQASSLTGRTTSQSWDQLIWCNCCSCKPRT